jgi:hypothetical protein
MRLTALTSLRQYNARVATVWFMAGPNRLMQSLNALYPMLVTLVGIVTLVSIGTK